jgi:two-component system phosphate regulon sensor histidine kinase PhoR
MEIEAIVNSMTYGIIAVSQEKKVQLINPVAREYFNIKDDSVLGKDVDNIIKNKRIRLSLEDTLENKQQGESEVMLKSGLITKISTTPIKNKEDVYYGALVVIQDITSVKKLEQIRTEFVSNVSHELKTPITSISGFVETLRNGAITNQGVAMKFLDIIEIETARLYTLINDILYLSEIETMQSEKEINEIDVRRLVKQVIEVTQYIADEKGIKIINEINEPVKIMANKDRIKQMLINLVDNGIKYNKKDGQVIVNAYNDGDRSVISIKDTGIGIPEKHIPRIFERFYRVDKSRSRSEGGTGLGLSIVKHIVNFYNGKIKVKTDVEKGTEFIIRFPKIIKNS